MSAFINPSTSVSTPPRLDAAHTAWNTVGSYSEYAQAQRAVDHLSDNGFPVEHLDIIGSDLRLVERVTGRLTKAGAAAALFGFLGHAATGGTRDFASARTLLAMRYDLLARNGNADAARHALQGTGLITAA